VFNPSEEPELALGVDKRDRLERVMLTRLSIHNNSFVLSKGVSAGAKLEMIWHGVF
jgi:hypothetical protein